MIDPRAWAGGLRALADRDLGRPLSAFSPKEYRVRREPERTYQKEKTFSKAAGEGAVRPLVQLGLFEFRQVRRIHHHSRLVRHVHQA